MSSINSPVKAIDNLQIEAWPNNQIFTPERIVCHGGVTVMKLKKGYKLYSHSIKSHISYSADKWPWTDGLMRCLVKLKIITQEQMNEHLRFVNENNKKREKGYALEAIKKYSSKYGFKITKEQLKKLNS